jgi:hypothetical protein
LVAENIPICVCSEDEDSGGYSIWKNMSAQGPILEALSNSI